MEKVAILFNPSSGKGRAGKKHQVLEKCLKEQGVTYDWFNSRSEDDLRNLVEVTADNYSTLIAAGGDTTFLIVINEMMRLGLDNTLGMIGLGSCNDVVREFEINSMKRACAAIRRNLSRRIDLGMVLEGDKILRYYPGQASIGMAVLINQYVEQVVKRSPRLGKYKTIAAIRESWRAFRSDDLPLRLTVEYANEFFSGEFVLAAFNNIRYYAAGKLITPRARTDDGLLDAFLIKKCSFSRLAYLIFLTHAANFAEKKEALIIQAPRFKISADKPFAVQIDGEVMSSGSAPRQFSQIEFACAPKSLKIIS
jgi:diacylglycerol kinase family enzyme